MTRSICERLRSRAGELRLGSEPDADLDIEAADLIETQAALLEEVLRDCAASGSPSNGVIERIGDHLAKLKERR